jgi:AIR synthase-related protein
MNAEALSAALRASRGFQHKRDISEVLSALTRWAPATNDQTSAPISIGDDCAAIPDHDGYLLFAIEGFVEDFVKHMPWFAGYCGVMVNVSDIYAMGGRPLAIVDALWSHGMDPASQMLDGMAAAAQRYAVPIVGGHSNNRADRGQLAVAILGRARRLLSSFAAQPGDQLIMAVDLRGDYEDPYPYWNASSTAPAERLRSDLELLPQFAESGLCDAAKDISMAGAIGTLLMMLECSRVGATIAVGAIPRPEGADADQALLRWLTAFPSYGFVLAVRPANVAAVTAAFRHRDLAVAVIGEVSPAPQVIIEHRGNTALLWDIETQPFMAARSIPPMCRGVSHA